MHGKIKSFFVAFLLGVYGACLLRAALLALIVTSAAETSTKTAQLNGINYM